MMPKILCVDDDPNILSGFQRNLRKMFHVDTALSGDAGLELLGRDGPYAVVVADMQMPGMNGIEFLLKARELAPDTVRMMLTGNADQKTAVDAVNQGNIFRFMNKPCAPEDLLAALEAGVKHYTLASMERELLEKTLSGSVQVLTDILSLVEPRSFGRGQILRDRMREMAAALKVENAWSFEVGAMLSSIGYVTIPTPVVAKVHDGINLSGAEQDMLAKTPEIGFNLLSNIPRLEGVAKIVYYQNKNFDGSGFPHDAVAGEAIPLGARILRILVDWIPLESKGFPARRIWTDMRMRTGRYDLKILDAMLATQDKTSSDPEAKTGRSIAFRDLKPGDMLLSDVETLEGVFIVPAGQKVTHNLLARLRNFEQVSGIREPILVE